jgi:molybdopterin-guanine dinucleotide biosynthesis protein A
VSEHGRAANPAHTGPIGAILAGGEGRRLGGAKALVELGGRPLISYPLTTLRAVLDEVAVVAKPDTQLPALPPGVEVWVEPLRPRHPVAGIIEALRRAGGRPVLVCAADMPFVTPATVVRLATADPAGAPAVIAASNPLLGLYLPEAARELRAAAGERRPLRQLVAALGLRTIAIPQRELFNVNTERDLQAAQPKVKS